MKIKTESLIGKALDFVVSMLVENSSKFPVWIDDMPQSYAAYSTDWAKAGPIIEREKIGLLPSGNAYYERDGGTYYSYGPTSLIAAMRCYVANKLGDEVEIPNWVSL